jgi:hypothetical protein
MQLLKIVVQKYRYLKSTDPRDKIYGLVGLVADPGDLDLDMNYESPVHEVYIVVGQSGYPCKITCYGL